MKRPSYTHISLKELSKTIGATLKGRGSTLITGVNNLEEAKTGELSFLANASFLEKAKRSQASAFIVSTPYNILKVPQLVTLNPQYAFVQVINRFFSIPAPPPIIAQEIWKGENVKIGSSVSIGPFVTLGNRAKVDDRAILHSGVCLANNVSVGKDSILHPNVTVLEGCKIGARVIIHAGTVVGSDGFGYLQHEGTHQKIPQRGIVVIEDDVEIGANVTIDRATFGSTLIKRGTKIDNQVQIAHNVKIGDNCIVVAQVGIAGSTTIGQQVMIGGQAGLVDHLTVGDNARITAGSAVLRDVKPGTTVLGGGMPALTIETALKRQVLIDRLPEIRNDLIELKKRIQIIEEEQLGSKKRKHRKK